MDNTTVTTAQYGTVITAIGAAKIAAGILNGEKVNITHAAVGDGGGNYYMPTTEQTALINECWRGEIAYARLSESMENMIDVKFIVPAEVGGFTVREAALIDADGDTIAICNTPDAQKIPITDGVSFPLTMVMHIIVSDASVVSFSINPALDTVSREEMEQAIDASIEGAFADIANSVGSAIIQKITIPAADWTEAGEYALGGYNYIVDVAMEKATENHFPALALDILSLDVAGEAEVCPTIETLAGIVRFWAKKIPTADLTGTILLRSENLVDLDIATDEEVDDTVDDVFGEGSSSGSLPDGYEIATDEEVAAMNKDIFGA